MKKYYIIVDEDIKGPFTLEELNEKKISPTTMVWKKDLKNWTEAKELTEIKTFSDTPPPLPLKKEKNKTIDNKNNNFNQNQDNEKNINTVVANELKITYKIFIYSIILGLLSYPFFAYKGIKAYTLEKKYKSYSPYTHSAEYEKLLSDIRDLLPKDPDKKYVSYLYNFSQHKWNYGNILKDNIYDAKHKAPYYSLYVAIITFIVILIGRYFYYGSKSIKNWVAENSTI